MKIFLNTVTGKPFDLQVNADDTISSVLGLTKGHFLSLGVDTPDDLRLIYKGVVLDKAKTIKECNVQDSDSLLVLYKLERKGAATAKASEVVTKVETNVEGVQVPVQGEAANANANPNAANLNAAIPNANADGEAHVEDEEEELLDAHGNVVQAGNPEDQLANIRPEQLAEIVAHIDWDEFPMPNPQDLENLLSMGFPKWRCQKALLLNGFDPEAAAEWMIMNIENPDVDAPLNPNQLRGLLQAFQQGEAEEQNSLEAQMREAVANNKCTYTVTRKQYAQQKWFFCYTCGFVDSEGVCEACANVCHKGHTLSEPKGTENGSFYCDCGASTTCICNK